MNRIILIGNGFDLAHGLPTRYEDFINSYWRGVVEELNSLANLKQISSYYDTYSDDFIKISISSRAADLLRYVLNNLKEKYDSYLEIREHIFNRVHEDNRGFSIDMRLELERVFKNTFFQQITDLSCRNWVDIENEYYRRLCACLENSNGKEDRLNKELLDVKLHLMQYLQECEEQFLQTFVINKEIQEKVLVSFKAREISIESKKVWFDFIKRRIELFNTGSDNEIVCQFFNTKEAKKTIYEFMRKYGDDGFHMGWDSIPNDVFPKELLFPEETMMVNFNYTSIADAYLPKDSGFSVNHIHGKFGAKEDDIIFGYGDELDSKYKALEECNDNRYLENIKSVCYLKSPNYRQLLEFAESNYFQVVIMGHSCGNSDRTLLNTLFEHKNCVSIKPFYHQKENGIDDYNDIVRNISRSFTNKQLMRDRVVNKTFCEPLPQCC